MPACPHAEDLEDVTPGAEGCEECLANGDTWVHLRLCLVCGHVGCYVDELAFDRSDLKQEETPSPATSASPKTIPSAFT